MIRRIAEAVLVLLGASALVLAAWLARPAEIEPSDTRGAPRAAQPEDTAGERRTLASLAMRRTPFRASGQPPLVGFGTVSVAPESTAAAPMPVPLLTGILWGPEPSAILEGLPGMEGAALLRTGERLGPIQVRRITRDRVELAGLDTVWVLRVRAPWH